VLRIAGVLLLVAGVAGLAVGTFQYTRNKEVLDVGPLHVQAKQKETVTVRPLAAAGVAALGLVLVLAGKKK
jgi:hypothetical protein